MKKSVKPFVAAMLMVSSLGLVSNVSAMPYGGGPGGGCGKMGHHGGYGGKGGFNVERMSEKLNLTAEQRSQVEAIVEKSAPQTKALAEKMKQNRASLHEAGQQHPLDEAKVQQLANAQGDLKAEMIMLRMQQRSQIHALLTEEQRAQMKNMRSKRR